MPYHTTPCHGLLHHILSWNVAPRYKTSKASMLQFSVSRRRMPYYTMSYYAMVSNAMLCHIYHATHFHTLLHLTLPCNARPSYTTPTSCYTITCPAILHRVICFNLTVTKQRKQTMTSCFQSLYIFLYFLSMNCKQLNYYRTICQSYKKSFSAVLISEKNIIFCLKKRTHNYFLFLQ